LNFFLRQSITGLLRHAADTVPETREAVRETAEHLDRSLSVKWLDRAFDLFQQAAFSTRDPVFVSGAVWTAQALREVSRFERRAGALPEDEQTLPVQENARVEDSFEEELDEQADREAMRGVTELFERIRLGASLDEALALFPLLGDECEGR
jgi:hypothetical protein